MEILRILIWFIFAGVLGYLLVWGAGRRAYSGVGFAAVLLVTLCGGAPGVLLSLWRRGRPEKENMMLYTAALMALLWQVTGAAVWLAASNRGTLRINVIAYLLAHTGILLYIGIVCAATFLVFFLDKRAAVSGKRRIPIVTLLGLCLAGGAAGGLLGMYCFRHKTQKNYFTIGVPLMLVWHMLVLLLAMNI